jgi:hypothetical protein
MAGENGEIPCCSAWQPAPPSGKLPAGPFWSTNHAALMVPSELKNGVVRARLPARGVPYLWSLGLKRSRRRSHCWAANYCNEEPDRGSVGQQKRPRFPL